MNKQDWLLDDIKNFFEDYLKKQRSLSPNTILAYRDTLRLLIYFSEKHLRKTHLKFTVDDLTLDLILAFLDHIENVRQNSTKTRNSRLAALKTFFTFLAHQHPLQSSQFQRIIAIPTKKSLKTPPHYLQTDQVQTLLQSIGRKSFLDRRDYCLILLLYSTGARASEICNLTVDNIRFESPMMISLLGKGQKIRQIPLCKETLFALKDYMIEQEIIQYPSARIFSSKRGGPLNRFTLRRIIQRRVKAANQTFPQLALKNVSPHTFRHTTAMHMLQSGVDLTIIKTCLGHVNLSTTHDYLEIDIDMKRKALSACAPLEMPDKLKRLTDRNRDVIKWLDSLSAHPSDKLRAQPLCDLAAS